jgi:hypothetical protein
MKFFHFAFLVKPRELGQASKPGVVVLDSVAGVIEVVAPDVWNLCGCAAP